MRIACLQFAPQVGDVNNNLNRADAVLNKANPEDIDLLVLPELAFSGYNFKSLQHIAPFLEPSGSGISSLWARTTALKYDCTVALGYPEKVDVAEKWPTSPEYYNSAILVNGDGETIANYRKSFLYYTDETWALEGDGFFEGHVPGLGHTAIGICMDINPYRFESAWHEFEFAFHILEYETNLVILSMAWLTREDQRTFSRMPKEPDMETLTYWITRLEPVIRSENEDEIIVVFCNRTGSEDDAVYAGTSAVIGIKQGEVNVYGILGRGDKELLVVDTDNAPFAQLVYRPGDEHKADTTDLRRLSSNIEEHLPGGQQFKLTPSVVGVDLPRKATPNPADHPRESPHEKSSRHTNGIAKGHKNPPSESASERSTRSYTSTKSVVSAKLRASSKSSSSRVVAHKKSGSSKPSAQAQPKPQVQAQQSQLPKLNTRQESIIKSPRRERPSPKITIPVANPKSEEDTIPTPTAPSPTPIDLRPSFGGSSSARRGRRGNNDDTPHPVTGPHRDPWQIYGGHVSVKHEPFTPITPFPDVETPASPRYFWVPSDNLLKTPGVPQHARGPSSRSRSYREPPNEVETPLTAIQVHGGTSLDTSQQRHVVPRRTTPHPTEVRNANPSRSTSHRPREPSRSRQPAQGESLLDQPNPPVSDQPLPARPSSPNTSRQPSRQRGQDRPGSAMGRQTDKISSNEKLAQSTQRPGSSLAINRPGSAMAIQRPGSSMATQRPGSAMANQRPGSAMANQRPGSSMAIQRPGSAMASRRNGTPARPSSPKSRNASRSRGEIDPVVDQRLTNMSRASILIAASPSIYDDRGTRPRSASFQQDALDAMRARNESRNTTFTHRPASALGGRYDRPPTQAGDRSQTPLMPVNFVDPDDRTISRGRQREPRHYEADRSHSANSTWPEVPQSRFPSPDRALAADEIIAVEGTVSPNCPVHGAHHSPGAPTVDEIVAIEGTVDDSCPVHGSHSRPPHQRRRTDSALRRSDSTQARHTSTQRRGSDRRESAQRHGATGRRESTQRRESNRRRDSTQRHAEQNQVQRYSPPQQHAFSRSKDSPKYSTSVETLATPAGSPATPQQEPSTPKAMVLFSEKDLLPIPSQVKEPVKSVSEMHAQLACRDRDDMESHIHRPKSAVW